MSSAQKICPTCGTEYPANERFCNRDGAALRSQEGGTDLVGSVIADRYHIMKKLGEGGMGQVYLAEHVKMGRKSAVKVMHPGMVQDVDAISRFNREAANASRINHPNVAGIYDFGETPEGIIYLAMEFIEGQSLTALIASQGALAPVRAAEIARQAADGLSVAHDMGIVHRDLKPDNIMIARTRDGGDLVKVVDFGIAKAAGAESQKVTKTGLVVGTPEYMSPEQLAGDKLDGRSDIYSLGLVAFNMLTGTLPFPSDSMQETMIMRLTDKPKPLAAMKPDVAWPADVQAVMDKVLERDVKLRYQTASEFGRELYRTVERMPATKMVEMGTQVMGAGAAAAALPVAGAGATAAVPAPMPPSAPAVPATRIADAAAPASFGPATPAGKSKGPMYAGIAVVVLALGAGGYFAMNHGKPPASQPGQTQAPKPNAADSPKTSDPGGAHQPNKRDTNPSARGGPTPRGSTPDGSANPPGGMTVKQINTMLQAYDDSSTADGITLEKAFPFEAKVEALRPHFNTAQSVWAALIKGDIETMRDDNGKAACQIFQSVRDDAVGTPYERRILSALSRCPEPSAL